MHHFRNECDLFRTISGHIRADLCANGWSDCDAGEILNWFDPANPQYLERVDAWQKLLCAGAVSAFQGPRVLWRKHVVHHTSYGTDSVMEAEPGLVREVHQVAKLFYKFHGVARRKTDFNEVKTRLRQPCPISLEPWELDGIRRKLSCLRPPFSLDHCKGSFGPGVTAEGYSQYQRWSREVAIPQGVPSMLYCYNLQDWIDNGPSKRYRHGITKIAEVPKSLKSTRIVSSEPAGGMFAQKALANELVRELHRNFPGHVSLNDQARHNRLLWRDHACSVDLSDASDHISRRLVATLLPEWKEFLFLVRSQFARFPDGDIVPLRTFAPMGSGVCFPVLTAVSCGIISFAYTVIQPRGEWWWGAYGDDWIVRWEVYDYLVDLASRSGLVVNRAKSSCSGIYRESCGLELFRDQVITPLYIRDDWTTWDAAKTQEFAASAADPLMWSRTVDAILAEKHYRMRWNSQLQRWEVRVPSTVYRKLHPLSGRHGINRWFAVNSENHDVSDVGSYTKRIFKYEDVALYYALVDTMTT